MKRGLILGVILVGIGAVMVILRAPAGPAITEAEVPVCDSCSTRAAEKKRLRDIIKSTKAAAD